MKSHFLFALMVFSLLVTKAAFATIHVIQVGPNNGFTFSPSSITFPIGDTIEWVWSSGTHTTTSDAAGIPVGAASWDQPINASNTTYMYKPTVTGVYNYHCTFHQGLGMIGNFTVTSPTTVTNVAANTKMLISPNPATGTINIPVNGSAIVEVYNLNGSLVRRLIPMEGSLGGQTYRIDEIAEGTYFIHIRTAGATFTEKLIIAR
ncbi:MAG: T9SS type A sorting domain-containing protein [Bacteroidetes bacterium]|nr:T9SS type A sorting domain-containing protein [Bacteroidota bacterium]